MRARQQRERPRPGEGNNKTNGAVVFNGDVGEPVEHAITIIKGKLGTDGLGYLLDGDSPHDEDKMECINPGPRPQQHRRSSIKPRPSAAREAVEKEPEESEDEEKVTVEGAAESEARGKKYSSKLAAAVTEGGQPKAEGQQGYMSPSGHKRARTRDRVDSSAGQGLPHGSNPQVTNSHS